MVAGNEEGGGGFAATYDADSEGVEGKFYVWDEAEIDAILGAEDAAFFKPVYDVTPQGNWEHHTILHRNRAPALLGEDEERRLAGLRARLKAVRDRRVWPGWDDKVLADWNGLMIAALANAGALLRQPAWIALASRAFAFVVSEMNLEGRLGHSWRDGKLLRPGLASDHAAMVKAALALHEATGVREFLGRALQWQITLDRHYINRDTGGYYLTADDAEDLVVRPDSLIDEATPNPNGVAAQNLVRLAILTGDDIWRERADIMFDGLMAAAAEAMHLHASLLNGLDLRQRGVEIVAIGPDADRFADAALALPFLDRVVARAAGAAELPGTHASRELALDGTTAALVCAGQRCSLPITDPAQLAARVAAMRTGKTGTA
jgi:uncharacterized protein YyaL (SSP411 family)